MKKRGLVIFLLVFSILISGCSTEISEKDQILVNTVLSKAQKNGVQECDSLPNKLKTLCVDEYYIFLTMNERDNSYCDKVSLNKKQECLDKSQSTLALDKKDVSLCDSIVDSGIKDTCKERISEFLSNPFKIAVQDAISNNDITKCDILDKAKIPVCKDNYYNFMASSTGDKSYCNKIQTKKIKEICSSK